MEARTEKLTKGKKEEKTYSADVVKNHIDIYSEMVHLTNNYHVMLFSSTKKKFEDIIEKAEKEFLEEFKDEGFYYYLDEMKKTLKR